MKKYIFMVWDGEKLTSIEDRPDPSFAEVKFRELVRVVMAFEKTKCFHSLEQQHPAATPHYHGH